VNVPYQVVLRPAADKALSKLPRDVQARIISKTISLAENPRPSGVKKLQGQLNLYRVAVGSYRIAYSIDDPHRMVTVTIIPDRKESYRGL
jgi:mRNA interferase RelE/StbE